MWKFLAKISAAVFGACLLLLSAVMKWRADHVEWRAIFFLALLATILFAVRAYFPLRADARRLFIQRERHRRRQRIRALGAAVNELIRSMARLSPGDLSLYHSLLEVEGPDEMACIVTSKGSRNHDILVQMTDLKLARPEEFKNIGEPPVEITIARYAFTPFGRSYIPRLMPDVLKLRAGLGRQGPHS